MPAMIFGLAMAGATSCVGSDSEGSVEPPEAVETDSSQVEEDVAEPDEADETEVEETDETEVEETEAESEAARGSGSGTVTMGDGTVYEIVNLTQCDTSATDPSGFPLETGYGIYGSTADGTVEIFFSRAGLDDDDAFFGGGIEGDFNGDGETDELLYSAQSGTEDISIDGPSAFGTVEVRSLGREDPHGEESTVEIDFTC